MKLKNIQDVIEDIYSVRLQIDIEDYLINNELVDTYIKKTLYDSMYYNMARRGWLLIKEEKECLTLGIYLERSLIENLDKVNTLAYNISLLSDFFTATEEISHFIYLVWKTQNNIPLTQLELEVQGEIDKFITAYFIFKNIRLSNIKNALFKEFKYNEGLNQDELNRYKTANMLALRFCDIIERDYIKRCREVEMIKYLRAFYRLNTFSKLVFLKQLPRY